MNLQAGCDGCELWNPAAVIKHCYAGTLTERYAGRPGWPESFDKPKLFIDRLDAALRWPDLTGKERTGKPWLNGRPRMIFLDDMGDTFTESLPLDWLAPLLPRMANSPHVFMLLTKRARRMREFSEAHPLPKNVWPGVSVTSQVTARRVWELWQVRGGGIRWVSAEPLLGPVDFSDGPLNPNESTMGDWSLLDQVGLLIAGGESGPNARPCDLAWIRSLRDQCRAADVACFVKQLGTNAVEARGEAFFSRRASLRLKDSKGGDIDEFPSDLRVREFPCGSQ